MNEPPTAEPPAARPVRQMGVARLGFVAVVALVMSVTVAAAAQVANLGFGLWFTEAFVFVAVPWIALRRRGFSPWRDAGLAGWSWRALGRGAVLGAANFLFVVLPLQRGVHAVFQRLAPDLTDRFSITGLLQDRLPIERVLIVSGAVVAAPFAEEYFFRGFLLRRRLASEAGRAHPIRAALVVAFVFSAFHLDPVGLLTRFEIGAILGLLFVRSGSLVASFGVHAMTNAIACSALLFAGESTAAPEELGPVETAAMFATALVGTAFLVRAVTAAVPEGDRERFLDGPEVARVSWWRSAPVWVVCVAAAFGGLAAVDWRGMRLGVVDVRHMLPKLGPDATPDEKEARAELGALRKRARRGEATIEAYAERRAEVAAGRR